MHAAPKEGTMPCDPCLAGGSSRCLSLARARCPGLRRSGCAREREEGGREVRIGIIGAGHIGGTLAKLVANAGHEVSLSNSRGPETLVRLVEELGGRVQALTAAEAERFGEVVVVSVPFGRYRELPAEAVAGK